MPGCASEKVRIPVMDFPPDNFTPPSRIRLAGKVAFAHVALVGVAGLASRDARAHRRRRIEEGVLKLQRFKDFGLCEFREGPATDALQKEAESNETEVTVNHAFTCRMFKRLFGDCGQ